MGIIDKIMMGIFILIGKRFFDEVEVQGDDKDEYVLWMKFSRKEEKKK